MIRFPYILEMWYEEDAMQDPDTGEFIEGAHEWRTVGKCNARQNGQARMVKGASGEAFLYSYEVIMPVRTSPIPLKTKVRIIDSNGINIFNHKPRNDNEPSALDNATYPVQGFYQSGQRYEDTKIWL